MRKLLIVAVLIAGCSWKSKVKNLDGEEFNHYYALRVYMEDAQKKEYLKLKTREERDEYLKASGMWDRFYKYEPHIRELIVGGEVQEDWTRDMVYMAWGTPYERRKLTGREASRSELLVYRFERHEDGRVLVWAPGSKTEYKATALFEQEVILDDDVVTEVRRKESSW